MSTKLNITELQFGGANVVKEYFELTDKYNKEYNEDKCILLMLVGSFFEVYGLKNIQTNKLEGSNISEFSRICDLNIADKNVSLKEHKVVMAGFKDFMLEKYVKKLQEASFTIVVYTQEETANQTFTRGLYAIYSPGTFFSNEVTQITNNTICVWIHVVDSFFGSKRTGTNYKKVYVGVANINIYTGKSSIFEFNEIYINNPATFDELERFVSIYTPNEAIIIANVSSSEIENIISYANIQCGSIHVVNLLDKTNKNAINCEKQIYQKQLLERFYTIPDFSSFIQSFNNNVIATQAFCYLLDFIYQHNPNLIHKIDYPVFENCSDRLILANHSLKQLNIIDDHSYTGKYSSVLKMLNTCITSMGKRSFSHSFLNPTTNIEVLQNEYNMTEYLLDHFTSYAKIKEKLETIKDISKMCRQIMMKRISPKSLHCLYKNTLMIKDLFEEDVQQYPTILNYMSSKLTNLTKLSELCEEFVDFIETHFRTDKIEDIDSYQSFETTFIQEGIHTELDEQNKILMESMDKLECCRNYFNQMVANHEKKAKPTEYIKIHETEKNNFTLIGTDRRCKILKTLLDEKGSESILLEYISSYNQEKQTFEMLLYLDIQKQTASNSSISTPQILQICKNINYTKTKIKELTSVVYNNIIVSLEDFTTHFDCFSEFVVNIDMIYSKANIAKKYNYCKPSIETTAEKSFVQAKNIRHCLIEQLQEDELYIANDITIGTDSVDGMLLYGTNAVGKTSLIRALGISVIMAQSGLYVPASAFNYSPYKYIFTRILGNDNIFKGLSTFAVEMSELRTILRYSTANSLILGDELCSGTENISAISIFVAGIQRLHQIKCSFIFATHLHEIVNFDEIKALNNLVCKHLKVKYDRERGILVYDRKLCDGSGDKMYGLEVCKSLFLPEDFLSSAHDIRMKYYPETSSILSLKTSQYNSNKIKGMCERCNTTVGTEVHHLQHQKDADNNGIIQKDSMVFHKNHLANLITLCEKCHVEFHVSQEIHKKVKTNVGVTVNTVK